MSKSQQISRGFHRLAMLLAALGLMLCACDDVQETGSDATPAESSPSELPEEMREVLAQLPADPTLAAAELDERLKARVKVSDGLIIVEGRGLFSKFVLPATTPWIVRCGMVGVSVILGTAVSGSGENVGNDIDVLLHLGPVKPEVCDVIAPRLAKSMQAMLAG